MMRAAAPNTDAFVLQWHAPLPPQAPVGVALVAHGLNVNPARMAPLIELLTANGIEAVSIALHGHGENYLRRPGLGATAARLESLRNVTYQLWRDEFYAAYQVAAQRAAQLDGAPLHLVGYSLGGLIGCDLFASAADVHFDRMALLAPALQIRGLSYVLAPFTGAGRVIIPSFAPATYRANRGTSLAAYAALYQAAAHLAHNAGPKINVPTLVFLDAEDELVAYAGTARLLARAGLTNWRLARVQKDNTAQQRYHHLLIDAPSLGQEAWARLAAAIVAHLRGAQ
jgi:alpha-beta hydrolase superfamily lysophospholipase